MKVLFTGRKPKNEVLLQAFGVAMRAMENNTLDVWSSGNFMFNDTIRGYVNILENSFKSRDRHVHYHLAMHPNPKDFDMVIWFASPSAKKTKLIERAESEGTEVVIFRH